MDIRNFIQKAIIFNFDDSVSKATSMMIKKRMGESIVLHDGEFVGVLDARSIAKKTITLPSKTKIGRLCSHIKPMPISTPIRDLIGMALENDYASVPVVDDKGTYFFLTKLGMLKSLMHAIEIRKRKVGEVSNIAHCINSEDKISNAMRTIRELGVSRIPVMSKTGNVEGIVNSLGFLRSDIDSERMTLGEEVGEKRCQRDANITSIMERDFPVVDVETSIKDAIGLMCEKSMPCAIVTGDKSVGILTSKPILRLFHSKPSGPFIRVSGLHDEGNFARFVIDEQIRSEAAKLGKISPIDYFVINVGIHKKEGSRKKYSVKGRIITKGSAFFASSTDWDFSKAVMGTISKLETELLKKRDRAKSHR